MAHRPEFERGGRGRSRAERRAHFDREDGREESRDDGRHEERRYAGGADRGEVRPFQRRRPQRDSGDMVRFFVNWGANQGVNPRRLLAALCRRGKVTGKDIGAIAIHPNASTFDVRADVAESFERHASRPDVRDPRTRIRRDRGPGERAPAGRRESARY